MTVQTTSVGLNEKLPLGMLDELYMIWQAIARLAADDPGLATAKAALEDIIDPHNIFFSRSDR